MKALSIRQPEAWLICVGYKDVENRSWETKFRGRIYVHASLYKGLMPHMLGWYTMRLTRDEMIHWEKSKPEYGAIIGEVDIVDCKYRFPDENDNLYSKWHDPGAFGFKLVNPVLYKKPIPYKGQLKFFEVKLVAK